MEIRTIYSDAVLWTREAGKRIKSSFCSTLRIDTKSNANDLVTNIDKETERFFIEKIKEKYPHHRILGEEGFGDEVKDLSGIVWIIDPIDGTTNFVHQQRNFAISVAVYENGIGKIGLIYDVVHEELYHAVKGEGAFMNEFPLRKLESVPVNQAIVGINATWVTKNRRIDPTVLRRLVEVVRGTRSYGSAAIEMAYVAANRLDAYISLRLSPWDFAAALIIIEEVGGVCRTLKGEPIDLLKQCSIFVSKPGLYETVLRNYLNNGAW